MKFCAVEIQKMLDRGMSRAQISREIKCSKSNVSKYVGTACDTEQWEAERKAAVEFFGEMTPQQEYSEHIKKRNEARDKFGEIE